MSHKKDEVPPKKTPAKQSQQSESEPTTPISSSELRDLREQVESNRLQMNDMAVWLRNISEKFDQISIKESKTNELDNAVKKEPFQLSGTLARMPTLLHDSTATSSPIHTADSATASGIAGEDVLCLESQYTEIRRTLTTIEGKIIEGYQVTKQNILIYIT